MVGWGIWYVGIMKNIDVSVPKNVRYVLIGLVVLVWFLPRMIVVVPAGTTGVFELFGRVADQERSSGLNVINPFGKLVKMSIRTEEYTMSIVHAEGRRTGADSIRALTSEGLEVDLDITVFYRLMEEKASDVYTTVGLDYDEVIIRPEIRSGIREVISEYAAKALYSEKRQEAGQEILKRLAVKLEQRGILVEDVLLRNIALPAKLTASIEEKLTAEQEAQRMEFVLQKEEKEAERKRIEAEGQRDAQAIINESLTSRYLNYVYVNSLENREGTIYVPVDPGSGLPLFRNVP